MATLRTVPVTPAAIRRATAADGPQLFIRWQRARTHNASMDRRVVPAPISETEFLADFAQMLSRPGSVALVAEVGTELAGFISGAIEANQPDRLPARHATVGYLYVDDAFRRQGIARALFAGVAEWAQEQEDVSHFEMSVLHADESAALFWRSIGFTPFISRLWAPLSAPDPDP
jgi:ribosomal protein S18 acetylase RimI-like enzyme